MGRQDKRLSEDLSAKGIANFLPLLHRVTLINRERRQQAIPVIPGYVFVCGDDESAYQARIARQTVAILPVHNQARLVRELVNLQRSLSHPVELYAGIARGGRYRVTHGVLMGVVGIVVGPTANGLRFVISVEMLGRGVEAEVDADYLEAA